MKKGNIVKKLICGVVAGSMLLSAGVFVYADNSGNNAAGRNIKQKITSRFIKASNRAQMGFGGMNMAGLSTVLDNMVEEGTLSKEKADAIKKYIEQKKAEREKMTKEQLKAERDKTRVSLLDQMVNDGIISKDDSNAIMAKKKQMIEQKQQQMEQKRTKKLNSLVEKGIINQDQLQKINEYMKAAREERLQMHENAKGMTPSERKAYYEKIMNSKENMIQKMVDDGVITKDQANEIRKVLPGMQKHHFKGKGQHERKESQNQ